MSYLIPGEIISEQGEIELNLGKEVKTVKVSNSGDRPVQIGSHYHFFEANKALIFDREITLGMRLDIPAGTAIRFEPGDTTCLLYTSPSPRDLYRSRMPSSA